MNFFNIVLVSLLVSLNACAQKTDTTKMETQRDKIQGVNKFVISFANTFSNFKMDIKGAGMASIPKAVVSPNGELYIEYSYHSGEEDRNGKMTLSEVSTNRFEGNWKTIADNGNIYEGSLYFVFKENGEADGYYKFAGDDYKITILTK